MMNFEMHLNHEQVEISFHLFLGVKPPMLFMYYREGSCCDYSF